MSSRWLMRLQCSACLCASMAQLQPALQLVLRPRPKQPRCAPLGLGGSHVGPAANGDPVEARHEQQEAAPLVDPLLHQECTAKWVGGRSPLGTWAEGVSSHDSNRDEHEPNFGRLRLLHRQHKRRPWNAHRKGPIAVCGLWPSSSRASTAQA